MQRACSGRDEVRRALHSLLGRPREAGLAEIDQLHIPAGVADDVARLGIAVKVLIVMHRSQGRTDLKEDIYNRGNAFGHVAIEGDAVHQFHDQRGLGHGSGEKLLLQLQVDTLAGRGDEGAGDLVFGFELFDVPLVLFFGGDDVFEGVKLLRLGVHDGVDRTERAFADALHDFVAEKRLWGRSVRHWTDSRLCLELLKPGAVVKRRIPSVRDGSHAPGCSYLERM